MATLENIDHNQVTVGQPTEGGCVYVSFTGATVPTDATTSMSTLTGFESAGDISENGFTASQSRTTTNFKNWNTDTVLTAVTEDVKQYKLEFIETSRPVVAKMHYGSKNVVVGDDGSVKSIAGKPGVCETVALVIDELESNGCLRRTCIQKARIDTIDDEVHQKGSLLVFGATFTVLTNDNGKDIDVFRAKPVSA